MSIEKPEIIRSILENDQVKDFIEYRGIKAEHYDIIELLSLVPKNALIAPMHNFFSLNQHNSIRELQRSIREAELNNNAQRKNMYELFLQFCEAYDPDTAHHLERVLENI